MLLTLSLFYSDFRTLYRRFFPVLSATLLFGGPAFPLVADTALVRPDDTWRYRPGASAPAADWKTNADNGLDSSWLQGAGGIGYADNAPELASLQNARYWYGRQVHDSGHAAQLRCGGGARSHPALAAADGLRRWIHRLAGRRLPGKRQLTVGTERAAFNALASSSHESSRGNNSSNPPDVYDLGPVGNRVGLGTHVLSILGLNQSLTSSDFIQIPTLSLVTNTASSTNCLKGLLTADTVLAFDEQPVCDLRGPDGGRGGNADH